jgi:hypothetical protein
MSSHLIFVTQGPYVIKLSLYNVAHVSALTVLCVSISPASETRFCATVCVCVYIYIYICVYVYRLYTVYGFFCFKISLLINAF